MLSAVLHLLIVLGRLTARFPARAACAICAVELPEAYPYKSPSIGFVNRIFHPNVDEGRAQPPAATGEQSASAGPTKHLAALIAGHAGTPDSACAPPRPRLTRRAGSVCLDVINQTWSPMFGTQHLIERLTLSTI